MGKNTTKILILMYVTIAIAICISLVTAAGTTSNGISVSLVNQDPNPALAGDNVELNIGVTNVGDTVMNNVIVELVPSYPFELLGGTDNIQDAGTIGAYQGQYDNNIKILTYKIHIDKDTSAGTYELKIKNYEKGSDIVSEQRIYVKVKSKENAEIIHIDKTVLVPGRQSDIKFKINNVGNSPLKDLKFYWENSDKIILPVGSDNTRYIKYIEAGESADIEYQVIADSSATAGLYQLDLYLTYDSSTNASKKVSTIAGIYVGGETDFDVAFSDSTSGQTAFTIANIGSNPATSVSVIIPEQANWRVTGSNAVIIGNLNKGDYTVASFKLQSSNTRMIQSVSTETTSGDSTQNNYRQKNITIPNPRNSSSSDLLMQIAYTDTRGERIVVDKNIRISPQNLATNSTAFAGRGPTTTQSPLSKYQWYIIGIVVIILGVFIYRKYKNKNLGESESKTNNSIFKNKKK